MIIDPQVKPGFKGRQWQKISPQAKDFVQKCLEKNPANRLSAEEALRHPWLAAPAPTSSDVDITGVSQEFRRQELRRRFRKAVNAVKAMNRMAAWEGVPA
jgi:calcium/calmodulin-dependent protein kinase I